MVTILPETAKRVAILVENGFEDSEFQVPYTALRQAAATVCVLGSRMNEEYKGKHGKVSIKPDGTTTEARAGNFDAIVIPGGTAPDTMRTNPNAVKFVQDAFALDKLVAAICHGPQLLIEADLLRGKRATGFLSIRKDMENAGAVYIDEPLVVDGNLITSRMPGDAAIFTAALLSRLGLSIPNIALPSESDSPSGEWWQLAEIWGGSKQNEIVEGLNLALAGERYTLQEFEQYARSASDEALRLLLLEICDSQRRHVEMLEERLQDLGGIVSFGASAAAPYGSVMSLFQSNDNIAILRRVLGDIQSGVVDAYLLFTKYTDPAATAIFRKIEADLARYERRLADLYQERLGFKTAQPAQPTTDAVLV